MSTTVITFPRAAQCIRSNGEFDSTTMQYSY
jgi:hypothetical protein